MLPSTPLEVRHYLDERGSSPFREWFEQLDGAVRARIAAALFRLQRGHLSNVKPVGDGILEYRMHFGPGYRVYFARDGEATVILLAGGTRRRQQRDIGAAKACWADYKLRQALQAGVWQRWH